MFTNFKKLCHLFKVEMANLLADRHREKQKAALQILFNVLLKKKRFSGQFCSKETKRHKYRTMLSFTGHLTNPYFLQSLICAEMHV
jgi:hypothetical protein